MADDDFDPAGFVRSASAVLKGTSEADRRTAAGRAYYAVYGTIRNRLCEAKGYTPEQFFHRYGRHGSIVDRMSFVKPFKALGFSYRGLWTLRTRADYVYELEVDQAAATAAITSAKWLLEQLDDVENKHFETFPLEPINGPKKA